MSRAKFRCDCGATFGVPDNGQDMIALKCPNCNKYTEAKRISSESVQNTSEGLE